MKEANYRMMVSPLETFLFVALGLLAATTLTMTKVISKEQKEIKNGVKIVSIYPGIVDTDMQAAARNTPRENFKSVQRFIDFYEQGALTTPKQVAEKIYNLDVTKKLKNGRIVDVRNH